MPLRIVPRLPHAYIASILTLIPNMNINELILNLFRRRRKCNIMLSIDETGEVTIDNNMIIPKVTYNDVSYKILTYACGQKDKNNNYICNADLQVARWTIPIGIDNSVSLELTPTKFTIRHIREEIYNNDLKYIISCVKEFLLRYNILPISLIINDYLYLNIDKIEWLYSLLQSHKMMGGLKYNVKKSKITTEHNISCCNYRF